MPFFISVLMSNIPTGVSGTGGGAGAGNVHGSQVICKTVIPQVKVVEEGEWALLENCAMLYAILMDVLL